MNRFFQALLGIFFSYKKRSATAYPYRTLFVPDDVPVTPKDPWYGGIQKDLKSFNIRVKKNFDRVKTQIERLIPVMLKLISFVIFFGCLLGVGALYDINSRTTLGLRWAGAICCVILGAASAIFFFAELESSSRSR